MFLSLSGSRDIRAKTQETDWGRFTNFKIMWNVNLYSLSSESDAFVDYKYNISTG